MTDHKISKTSPQVVELPVKPAKRIGRRRPNVAVLLDSDDFAKEQFGGFVSFIREHAIVGLAVGFIIGQQAQGVVKQVVATFVDPFIKLIFGGDELSKRSTEIHLFHNVAAVPWGAMVYVFINLICVLATIYALIKIFKLDKLDKPKEVAVVETTKKKSKKHHKR